MGSEQKNDRINQLQMFEQSMQNIIMQKQQFQTQKVEIDSALKQLDETDSAYKIVANIMVKSDKPTLKKDLESKKETVELRIKNLEKQESNIREKAKNLQNEVLQGMDNKKNDS